MKVIFKRAFFGPNHVYYRKEEVHEVPSEWKDILPTRTEILEEDKKSSVKQADVKKVDEENDPKSVAKAQADEVSKIIEGKSK